MAEYQKLPPILKDASKTVGVVKGLGEKFVQSGVREMDSVLQPKLHSLFGNATLPRILQSYSMLLWFTLEVSYRVSLFTDSP